MIPVISLYQDAARDDVNESENGQFDYEYFNRNLRRAETNLLKFLTGDLVLSQDFPIPYQAQKIKDYLSPFITTFTANNGFALPEDYYTWENLYKLGASKTEDCDTGEIEIKETANKPIEILNGDKFNARCESYVEGLNPLKGGKPIAKIVRRGVMFAPKDIGSVCLEYIRYPKFGKIVTKKDDEHYDIVPDPDKSINLEWDEWAREPLIWFLTNKFSTHTSNKSLKENNFSDKTRG